MKTHYFFKLLTILFLIFYSQLSHAQCNYSIELYDSFGDGWNGGQVTVYVNGTAILNNLTLDAGNGPESHTFPVTIGDDITTSYTPDQWAYENSYKIVDSDGITITEDGAGGVEPVGIVSGTVTANCSNCPAPYNVAATYVDEALAIINWEENGTATSWNLEWGLQGFTLGSGNLVSTLNFTNFQITGLSQSTAYDFYVQADCGAEQSSWIGPINFETVTPPIDNPSTCNLNIPIPDGNSNCLDVYIDVNGLWGTQLGTDVTVKQLNIIIEHSEVQDISFSLTSPNQVTVPISYWNGNGNNYGINDGTCTQYASFSMAGPDGDCNSASAPFLGEYTPEQSFTSWYDNSNPNGMWRLRICDNAGGALGKLQYLEIEFNDAMPPTDIVINEIDVDQVSDTLEFVELYDGGFGNVSLNGFTLAFYNGSSNQIYSVFDLDGYSTDANGYFVAGNASVNSVDLIFNNGLLQDGADAVALYMDNASNLPVGTPVSLVNLSDAIVYGTGDATDIDLLPLLNSGELQFDEDELGNKKAHSCSRLPNGSGGLRNTSSFSAAMPTPGSENMGVPELIYLDTEFTESISNDGSIENEIDLHLMNNDFSSIGILSETIHYTTSDIPAGLSLEIETTTDTTALLRLTGNANSHIESDDISNLNITFLDAAFNTYTSDLVVNNSANLSVNFFDTPPATMLWFGDTLFENEVLDDGSINTSITVELISETFTVPTGNIYDFTFNNVPSGLNIDVQATDNTHALISLTGHADNHADIDDINNIEIIFTDGAFTGASAANVNGHSKSDISVDFYQYYSDATDILSFSLNEQTGPAEIDDLLHTVDIEVHQGTNIYNLIPTFDLSASASAYVNSNLQESGVSVNNFGLPVVYNIIAEDGLTNQDWTITVNLSNKITELQKGIKIYPNPAKDFVNIELPNFENSTCKFYNASGKLLNQIAIDNKKVIISTQNWNKGIYWIKLITNDNIINQKIIIE